MIDASIPLQAKLPQMPDLVGSFQRAQALKIQGQQLAENQIRLDAMRRAEKEQAKIREIYMKSGGDPDRFLSGLKLSSISPETVLNIEKAIADQKQKYMSLDEAGRKAQMEKYDRARAMLASIDEIADDTKAAEEFSRALGAARAMGLVDEQVEAGLKQIMPNGFSREGLQMLRNSLTTGSRVAQEAEKELRAQAALLRAQSYQQGIYDRIRNTDLRDERERARLELDIKNYERLLERDKNLDDIARLRIQNDLDIAKLRIQTEREREEGRNRRFREAESGRMERLKLSELGRTQRQKEYLAMKDREAEARKLTPKQMIAALNGALSAMGLDSLEDLDDENLQTFQNLFDALVSAQNPEFGVEKTPPKISKPLTWIGGGKKPTVSTPIEPPPRMQDMTPEKTRQAAPALPGEVIDRMPTGITVKITDPSGRVGYWVKNPDGSVKQVEGR